MTEELETSGLEVTADVPTEVGGFECTCPNEIEYVPDCPFHKAPDGACQRCGGLDGTHIFRDCNGAAAGEVTHG